MNKQLFLILLPALLLTTGCKQQQASGTEGTIIKVEAHQPLPPKNTKALFIRTYKEGYYLFPIYRPSPGHTRLQWSEDVFL